MRRYRELGGDVRELQPLLRRFEAAIRARRFAEAEAELERVLERVEGL